MATTYTQADLPVLRKLIDQYTEEVRVYTQSRDSWRAARDKYEAYVNPQWYKENEQLAIAQKRLDESKNSLDEVNAAVAGILTAGQFTVDAPVGQAKSSTSMSMTTKVLIGVGILVLIIIIVFIVRKYRK